MNNGSWIDRIHKIKRERIENYSRERERREKVQDIGAEC